MGHQIIKQPDGRLCVFSTFEDQIIVADATADDLVDWFAEEAAEKARREAQRLTSMVLGGQRRPYFQFTMTYDEAVSKHREMGGDEAMITRVEARLADGPTVQPGKLDP